MSPTFAIEVLEPWRLAEGWAFEDARVLGRIRASFDWSETYETFTGTLRVGRTGGHQIEAARDSSAWAQRPNHLPEIHRFVGHASPIGDNGTTLGPSRFILDYMPLQGYASGYLEQRQGDESPTRLSFHLFPDPQSAILALPDLLPRKIDLSPSSDARGTVAKADLQEIMEDLSGSRNSSVGTTEPEARVAHEGPLPQLPVNTGVAPWETIPTPLRNAVPALGVPYVVVNPSRMVDELNDNLTAPSEHEPGQPAVQSSTSNGGGEVSTTGGESQTGHSSTAGNHPPSTPAQPLGPHMVPTGEEALFEARAHDPELGAVSLLFDWGDGTTTRTGAAPSDTPAIARHHWADPGTYRVRAQAFDTKGGESAWSPVLAVTVFDRPSPDRPDLLAQSPIPITKPIMTGPVETSNPHLTTDESANFAATAIDPSQSSIRYLFYWDDDTQDWSPWVASGQSVTLAHRWSEPGTMHVFARAENTQYALSDWTEPHLTFTVQSPGGTAPTPPEISGPSRVLSTGTYTFTSTDADDSDEHPTPLRYSIAWGDGTTAEDSGWVRSGTSVTYEHTWSQPGNYSITASVKDDRAQSSTTTIVVSNINDPPHKPDVPSGWTLVPQASEAAYTTRAVEPGGDLLRHQYDWGDGTTSYTGYVESGEEATTGHVWAESGTYQVKVRGEDEHGAHGPWSDALTVMVGSEPFEFILSDLQVGNPTPTTVHPLDPGSTANAFTEIKATVENRASTAVTVDVVFYDDQVPIETRPVLLNHGTKQDIVVVYQFPGAAGKGVRQIRAEVDAGNKFLEADESNNHQIRDIRVRDGITGEQNFGAHYDGQGPKNIMGNQLTVGLYQRYRTADMNTWDELDTNGPASPMRLALWSENLTSTNVTSYFTERIQINVSGASFSDAYPAGPLQNETFSEIIPVGTGYTPRRDSAVRLDYQPVDGTALSTRAGVLDWEIHTHHVPTTQAQAVGVRWNAATDTSGWAGIQFNVTYEYSRVERVSADTYYLFHEVLRASNQPARTGIEAAAYNRHAPYAPGADHNLGDRTMTSSPTWNVSADTRRTYYDGVSDKSAQTEGGASDKSTAYAYFRLDGPIYESHNVTWDFYGPHDGHEVPIRETLHFAGPAERGLPEGSYFAWAEFRDGIQFDGLTLSDTYRGTWYAVISVDGIQSAVMTFHILAESADASRGPETMTDEEYRRRVAEQENALTRADPSNENLPNLDPTNKQYLDDDRVDGTLEAAETRMDASVAALVSEYLADQLEEASDITFETADPILPATAKRVMEPILYDVIETTRELPRLQHTTRTITRSVWSAADAIFATCGMDLLQHPPAAHSNVPDDVTTCLKQVVDAKTNATPLLTDAALGVLDLVTAAVTNVTTTLEYASGLVTHPLNDPMTAVSEAAKPIDAIAPNATGNSLSLVPSPPGRVNLNPKYLADNLALVYDTIMRASPEANGAKESAVSMVDSLFYNLYIANEDASQSWTFLNVAMGNATTINLDGDASTGVRGQDLLLAATLTPSEGSTSTPPTNASQTTPTLRIQSLSDVARNLPLLACAYHQMPGAPYVAATCLDTRNATLRMLDDAAPGRGFPDAANVTLNAYAFNTSDQNVTASLRLESRTSHASLPMLATGSIFQVDLLDHAKPRIASGDHADAALFTTHGDGAIEFSLRRTTHATSGTTSEWSWTATTRSDLAGAYHLTRGNRTLTASSNATIDGGKLHVATLRNAADTMLQLTTRALPPTAVHNVTLSLRDETESRAEDAYLLAADALPATFVLLANDVAGTFSVTSQGGTPAALRIIATGERASCPALTTQNQLTRQPANEEGGACLTMDLVSPVQSLTLDLASGGPRLAFASTSRTVEPLGILLKSGTHAPHSLDAFLSHVPATARLEANLAEADGSTHLRWDASEEVEHVRLQLQSGPTHLLWNATKLPTSVQASYQWALDTVVLQTSAPYAGSIQFLLTNTGSAPELPEGDYVTGLRDASGGFAASARLSGITEFRANLRTQNFQLSTVGSAGQPLGIRYARGLTPAFALDVHALPAEHFRLEATAQEGGTHRVHYTSGSRGASLTWTGNFPEGIHHEGNVTNAPASFTYAASPTAGTVVFDAQGDHASHFIVLRAAMGEAMATLSGPDAVQLQTSPGRSDSYRTDLRNVSGFSLTKSPGSLVMISQQTAEHPLRIQVNQDGDFIYADVTSLPGTARITYGKTGFDYEASEGSSRDWIVRVTEPGVAFGFTGHALPSQARLAWTSSTQTTRLAVAHNAANISLLHLEGNYGSSEADGIHEFVRARLEDVPPAISVTFNRSADELIVNAGPSPAGVLQYQHATNVKTLQIPQEPNHLIMRSGGSDAIGAFEAVRLENVTHALLRLGSEAGQANQLRLHATSPHGFYAEYATQAGNSLHARLSNLPADTDLQYTLLASEGTANAAGMNLVHSSGAGISSLRLQAKHAAFKLDVNATDIPKFWDAAWAPAHPFSLSASAAMNVNAFAYHAVSEETPSLTDADSFVLVDNREPKAPRIAAAFPDGVEIALSDLVARELRVSAARPGTFRLLHADIESVSTIQAERPPAKFVLRAPPVPTGGGIGLAWSATNETRSVTWGLDAPDARWRWTASQVPSLVTLRLDPTQGTFRAIMPSGAGERFRIQYTDDPAQPYLGEGPGLVLLVKPTGPEGHPASVTTFTLEMPHLQSAGAQFTGGNETAANFGVHGFSLRRTAGATPVPATFALASGADALRATADDVGELFDTSWTATRASGFQATVLTDVTLHNLSGRYRGVEGVANVDVTTVAGQLRLALNTMASATAPGHRNATLDYENTAASKRVDVFIDAVGALANLSLANASPNFHVDAPLQCASTGGSGRAWTTLDQSIGHAHLALVPRDMPIVPAVPEDQKLVATCEPNAATVQLDYADFQSATWSATPVDGALEFEVVTSRGSKSPARFVVAADERNYVLDVSTDTLPATISVAARGDSTTTSVDWEASERVLQPRVTLFTPDSFANVTHTNASPHWTILAAPAAESPLSYSANASSQALTFDVLAPGIGAHAVIEGAPSAIEWTIPPDTCSAATPSSQATVSTSGTGSIRSLTYWMLPGNAHEFPDTPRGEHAFLSCSENGAASTAFLTGVEKIAWTRTNQLALPPVEPMMLVAPRPNPGHAGASFEPAAWGAPIAALEKVAPWMPTFPVPPTSSSSKTPIGESTTIGTSVSRDPATANQNVPLQMRYDSSQSESVAVTASPPASSVDVRYTVGPASVRTALVRDTIVPAKVEAEYLKNGASTRIVFTKPAGTGILRLDGTAAPFAIEYTGSGPATGLSINTTAAGPRVVLDASGGLPTRLSGHVSGGPDENCSGADGPVSTGLSTLGTGQVGKLTLYFSDELRVPKLPTGKGAIYSCPAGNVRNVAAQLAPFNQFALGGKECEATIVGEADSLREANYVINTHWFMATATLRMAPTTVALFTANIGNGEFSVDTAPKPSLVVEKLNVAYEKRGTVPPGNPLPASCLKFGAGSLRQLFVDAQNLNSTLRGQVGADVEGRDSMQLAGGGTDALTIYALVDPAPPAKEMEIEPEARRLNLSIAFPITKKFNLTYHEFEKDAPQPTAADSTKNYAYLSSGKDISGGKVQLLGFASAGIVLNQEKPDNGTMQASGAFSYRATELGRPLAVKLQNADGSQSDIRIGNLPIRANASFNFQMKDNGDTDGNFTYEAYDRTSISVRLFDATRTLRTLAQSSSLTNKTSLTFKLAVDEHNDTAGEVHYQGTGDTPLFLYSRDESAAAMILDIDALPSQIDASFKSTTCGFTANATMGSRIDRIRFQRTPGVPEEVRESSSPSEPSRVTPGCPVSHASQDAKAKKGKTQIVATISGIPGGTLDLDMKAGSAGSAKFGSTGGAIGQVLVNVHTVDDKGTSRFNINARDVALKAANWDVDGDTRYQENPNYLYMSTGGEESGRIVFHANLPDKQMSFDTNGRVVFGKDADEGFQVRWYTSIRTTFSRAGSFEYGVDKVEQAGCMKLIDGGATLTSSDRARWKTWAYERWKGREWGRC